MMSIVSNTMIDPATNISVSIIITASYSFINSLTPTIAIRVQLIKHPVPDRVKQSFVIFDIGAL